LSGGRILVVDDEPQIRRILRETLTAASYEVDDARNGMEALVKLRDFRPDLILLDINMPEMGGVEVCRTIRRDSAIAIIMLTVRKSEPDKVAALDAGADDFITKPFSTPELLARVRAALRRVPVASNVLSQLQFGSLVIDFNARSVKRGTARSHLTPKELDVLRYLIAHADKAVSHREILQSVWGPDYGDQVDYLRVVVKNLRRKIERSPEHPHFIRTEPWVGYRFDTSPDTPGEDRVR
jgi:two-component system, OmpR family, KDP operon response regulator KdpE